MLFSSKCDRNKLLEKGVVSGVLLEKNVVSGVLLEINVVRGGLLEKMLLEAVC